MSNSAFVQVMCEWDSRDLKVWRGGKVERALATAASKAGGDAARAMRAESRRQVRARKKFKPKLLNAKETLPLTFPTSKEINRLAWRMDVSGAIVPVSAFVHRQTRKGVSVAIKRDSRALIKSAFVATMSTGHYGVFQRSGKFGRRNNPKLEKIQELYTTRVSDVFQDNDFIPFIQKQTQERYRTAFLRLMQIEFAKLPGGYSA